MKTTVVGLFLSCEDAKNAAKNLKNNGFKSLKLACKKLRGNRNDLFQEYFGSLLNLFSRRPETVLKKRSENLVTGIFSKNIEKLEKAKEILRNSGAVHVFSFENMSKVESKSRDFIMKMIQLVAKSEIKPPPVVRHHNYHEGISVIT